MTKQQQIELVDIDIKLLRWVSEIVADGSEIRSLSGRSARLGDGTSRNPGNRDELVAQRTKDLKGLVGQVRGFNLDEFLSDWEEPGTAVPWSPGDQPWVKSSSLASHSAAAARSSLYSFAAEEVTKRVKVLYVPDYVASSTRVNATSALWRELSTLLPKREVDLALSEGPFEDAEGIGAHFDVKT